MRGERIILNKGIASQLAKKLNVTRQAVSLVLSKKIRSAQIEEEIAQIKGVKREILFDIGIKNYKGPPLKCELEWANSEIERLRELLKNGK